MRQILLLLIFFVFSLTACQEQVASADHKTASASKKKLTPARKSISDAAVSIINPNILYDPAYFKIKYPMGDVPADRGVCTDVVIRTYRKLGIDLQKRVYLDMKKHFGLYPKRWGMKHTDTNIDHRRVPNLMTFFGRKGKKLPITQNAKDYKAGDIIVWDLGGGILHIGVIVDLKSPDAQRNMVVHNIGNGQIAEDVIFDWKIIGHYFYYPNK